MLHKRFQRLIPRIITTFKQSDITVKVRTRLITGFEVTAIFFSHLRSVLLNISLILVTITIGYMIFCEVRRKVIVIKPFHVASRVSQHGYSSQVISSRIGFSLRQISEDVSTVKEKRELTMPGSEVDVQIPGAGIGVQSMVSLIRKVFDFQNTVVNGDLIESEQLLTMRIVIM